MKRRDRQTAKLLSVSESTVGTTLSADAALGATTLNVDDVSVFDESGWLLVGSQVVAYTAIDDDAGTVTIADPLVAAADTDDFVARWSKLYDEVETVLSAMVAVLGSRDQADTLTVEVADTLVDLPTGDRGRDGENCTIESDGDVWTLISASGRPSKARGIKHEPYDPHTLTDAEIVSGSFTHQLAHTGIAFDRALLCFVNGVAYGPSNLNIDADSGVVTVTLGGWETVDEDVWFDYWYQKGPIAAAITPDPPPTPEAVNFSIVGSTGAHNNPSTTSAAWPADTEAGDLFVYACIARNTFTNACPDARADLAVDEVLSVFNLRAWCGTVSDPSTPLVIHNTGSAGTSETSWQLMVVRPERPVVWDPSKISDSGAQGTGDVPGLSGVSGALGVGFAIGGLGGADPADWSSPWTGNINTGIYNMVSTAIQVNGTVAATPALSTDQWRGFALGVGLG